MPPTKTVFDGLEGYALRDGPWQMVVITQCGPRIAFLGLAGEENLLYWQKDAVTHGEWRLHGGHRCWLTRPLADESEDAYLADNEPCRVQLLPNGLVVTAPAHPISQMERGMRVEVLDGGRFRVTNFIKNTGTLLYSGGVWSPTCINPEGKTITIPLGEDDATWDLVKIVIPRIFAGNEVRLDDPQVAFEGRNLVVRPMGQVAKRCVSAPKGLLRMEWPERHITFEKQVAYQRNAAYPLEGCNVAVFVGQDNWMAEMETFGIEQPIVPGQTIENEEVWELRA